jgi:HD-like signal output (HDOD) protein
MVPLVVIAVIGVGLLAIWAYNHSREGAAEETSVTLTAAASSGTAQSRTEPVVASPAAGGAATGKTSPPKLSVYLEPATVAQDWASKRTLALLGTKAAIPSFSAAALKLTTLTQDSEVSLDEMQAVVALDPGLATRCLRAASSLSHGGQPVATLPEALLRLGQRDIRRIAIAASLVDGFSKTPMQVDWHAFWLHSILVARVTERLGSAFQATTGVEYLAGLLHDCGKLFIQQHYPQQFEAIVRAARERNCGFVPVEREILGLDHAQIGAAICACLNLHEQIIGAVWHHHCPHQEDHIEHPDGDNGFLAACLAVANSVAHRVVPSIGGEADLEIAFEELPEWHNLARFPSIRSLDLDLRVELEAAQAELKTFFPG